jgi:hypothetical protein
MDDRAERLKAALRENLKRRKAQGRARATADKPQSAPPPKRDQSSDPER